MWAWGRDCGDRCSGLLASNKKSVGLSWVAYGIGWDRDKHREELLSLVMRSVYLHLYSRVRLKLPKRGRL